MECARASLTLVQPSDLVNSNSIEVVRGNLRINRSAVTAELFPSSLPQGSIEDYLATLESHVRAVAVAKGYAAPTSGAFNNVRGAWFQTLVAVVAWNYAVHRGSPNLCIATLPDVVTFDFRRIFDSTTRDMLSQLEQSLAGHDVRLVSSNPDLIIVDQPGAIQASTPVTNMSLASTETVLRAHRQLEGQCQWDSLKAGIGAKSSLRPDRRLQLVHEGNITKALFAHLKMRNWNSKARLGYYGVSMATTGADDLALQTAATHTITSVDSVPERAVDMVYAISQVQDIDTVLGDVLKRQGIHTVSP